MRLLEEFNLLLNLGYTAFQVVGQSRNSLKITKWKEIEGKEIVFHHLLHSSGPFGLDLDDGSWLPANKAIRKYKLIFVKYRLFGDHGLLTGEKIRHRHIRVVYQKILRRLRLNSDWYDTHARR